MDDDGTVIKCGRGYTTRTRTVPSCETSVYGMQECAVSRQRQPCAVHGDGSGEGPDGYVPDDPTFTYSTSHCPKCTEYEPFRPCSAPCCNETNWNSVTNTCDFEPEQCRSHVPIPHMMDQWVSFDFCAPKQPEDCAPCNTHRCETPAPTKAPTPPTKAPTQAPTTRPYSVPVCNVLDGDYIVLDASRIDRYVDAGATCDDVYDGNLNRHVKVSGQVVNLADVGSYQIRYDCKNSIHAAAETCVRTVVVKDMTCPSCVMNMGPAKIEASFPYFDSGAICTDDMDGPVDATALSNVNVEATGTYFVTYRAQDDAKNWNDGYNGDKAAPGQCKGSRENIRTVVVVDTLRPVLGLQYKSKMVGFGDNTDISDTPVQYRNPVQRTDLNFGALMTETGKAVRALNPRVLAVASGALGLALLATAAARRRL